jgi:hypothetical protein
MPKRMTIYIDSKLHQAVRIKAIQMNISVSELVNEAVRMSLKEDAADLQAINARTKESSRSFETMLRDLKQDRLL